MVAVRVVSGVYSRTSRLNFSRVACALEATFGPRELSYLAILPWLELFFDVSSVGMKQFPLSLCV